MYVAQTPHIDPLMFHLALQQNAETDAVDGAEKTAFAWYASQLGFILRKALMCMLHCVCCTVLEKTLTHTLLSPRNVEQCYWCWCVLQEYFFKSAQWDCSPAYLGVWSPCSYSCATCNSISPPNSTIRISSQADTHGQSLSPLPCTSNFMQPYSRLLLCPTAANANSHWLVEAPTAAGWLCQTCWQPPPSAPSAIFSVRMCNTTGNRRQPVVCMAPAECSCILALPTACA